MLRDRFGESISRIISQSIWPIQEIGDFFIILVFACLAFFAIFFYENPRRATVLTTLFAMLVGAWLFQLVREGTLPIPLFLHNFWCFFLGEQAQGEYEGEEDEAADCNDDSSYAANADDTFESLDVGSTSESLKEEEASTGLGDLSASYSGASFPPNLTVVWPDGNTSAAFRSADGITSGTVQDGEDLFFDGTVQINAATLQETLRIAMAGENGAIEILGGVDDLGGVYATDEGWGSGKNKAKLDQLFRYMATMDARDNAQGATPQRQKLQRKLLQRSAGAAAAAGGTEAEVAGGGGSADSRGNATGASAEAEDVLQDSGKMEALLRELGEHGTVPKACGPSKRAKPKRSSAPRNSRGGGGGATSLKEPAKQQLVTGTAEAVAEVPAKQEEAPEASLSGDAAQPLQPAVAAEPAKDAVEAQADVEAAEDFGGPEGPDFGIEFGFGSSQLGEGFKVVANRKARRKGRQRSSATEAAEGPEALPELARATVEAAPGVSSVTLEPTRPRANARGSSANVSAASSGGANAAAVRSTATATTVVKLKPTRAPWATEEVSARAARETQIPCSRPCKSGSEAEAEGDRDAKAVTSGDKTSEAVVEAKTAATGPSGVEEEVSKEHAKAAEHSSLESQGDGEDSVKIIPNPDPNEDEEFPSVIPDGQDREASVEQAAQGEDHEGEEGEWDDENDEDWEWQCPSGYRLEQYICPRPMVCSSCGKMQPEGAPMLRAEVSAWAACQECLNLAWEQPVEPNPPSASWSGEASQPAAEEASDAIDPSRMSPTEIAAWFKQYGAEDALRDCMKQVLAQVGQQSGTLTEASQAE